jgi:hypothetical protein
VHFVNADASGRVPLTFGTDTVRFVNPTPRALRVLTKSTARAPLNAQLKFVRRPPVRGKSPG